MVHGIKPEFAKRTREFSTRLREYAPQRRFVLGFERELVWSVECRVLLLQSWRSRNGSCGRLLCTARSAQLGSKRRRKCGYSRQFAALGGISYLRRKRRFYRVFQLSSFSILAWPAR